MVLEVFTLFLFIFIPISISDAKSRYDVVAIPPLNDIDDNSDFVPSIVSSGKQIDEYVLESRIDYLGISGCDSKNDFVYTRNSANLDNTVLVPNAVAAFGDITNNSPFSKQKKCKNYAFVGNDSFILNRHIFKGGHGEIWRGFKTDGGDEDMKSNYILKRMHIVNNTNILQCALREIYFNKILLDLPRVARFVTYFKSNDAHDIWLVFKDEGISLSGLFYTWKRNNDAVTMHSSSIWRFTRTSQSGLEFLKQLMYEVIAAVGDLHKIGILHRDIKPSNILINNYNSSIVKVGVDGVNIKVDNTVRVVLADFSSAVDDLSTSHGLYGTTADGTGGQPTIHEETLDYAPPEVILSLEPRCDSSQIQFETSHIAYNTSHPYAYDSWSIGVVFLEFLLGTNEVFRVDPRSYSLLNQQVQRKLARKEVGGEFQACGASETNVEIQLRKEILIRSLAEYCLYTPLASDATACLQESSVVSNYSYSHMKEAILKRDTLLHLGFHDTWGLDLLRRLLAFEPGDRISMQDALKHAYFTGPYVSQVDKSLHGTKADRIRYDTLQKYSQRPDGHCAAAAVDEVDANGSVDHFAVSNSPNAKPDMDADIDLPVVLIDSSHLANSEHPSESLKGDMDSDFNPEDSILHSLAIADKFSVNMSRRQSGMNFRCVYTSCSVENGEHNVMVSKRLRENIIDAVKFVKNLNIQIDGDTGYEAEMHEHEGSISDVNRLPTFVPTTSEGIVRETQEAEEFSAFHDNECLTNFADIARYDLLFHGVSYTYSLSSCSSSGENGGFGLLAQDHKMVYRYIEMLQQERVSGAHQESAAMQESYTDGSMVPLHLLSPDKNHKIGKDQNGENAHLLDLIHRDPMPVPSHGSVAPDSFEMNSHRLTGNVADTDQDRALKRDVQLIVKHIRCPKSKCNRRFHEKGLHVELLDAVGCFNNSVKYANADEVSNWKEWLCDADGSNDMYNACVAHAMSRRHGTHCSYDDMTLPGGGSSAYPIGLIGEKLEETVGDDVAATAISDLAEKIEQSNDMMNCLSEYSYMPLDERSGWCDLTGRRKIMEDTTAFGHSRKFGYTFYGVFDGHYGFSAASYASIHMIEYIDDELDSLFLKYVEQENKEQLGSWGATRNSTVISKFLTNDIIATAINQAFIRMDQVYGSIQQQEMELYKTTLVSLDGYDRPIPFSFSYKKVSGTTVTIALLFPPIVEGERESIYVANVGDSHAVLCCDENQLPILVTTDHTPYNPLEAKRIMDLGGNITGESTGKANSKSNSILRVQDALAVTRSIGDNDPKVKYVLSARPSIHTMSHGYTGHGTAAHYYKNSINSSAFTIDNNFITNNDNNTSADLLYQKQICSEKCKILKDMVLNYTAFNSGTNDSFVDINYEFMILATDGLWDVLSIYTATEIVCEKLSKFLSANLSHANNIDIVLTNMYQNAARLLAREALLRGSRDNIGVCVIDAK